VLRSRLRRPSSTQLRVGLLLAVAASILLMHSVIAVGTAGGHHPPSASHGSTTIGPAAHQLDEPTMDDAGDCDTHQHPCMFLRNDDPVVIAIAVLVLAWGFPIPPLLRSIHARLVGRSGRPPPWAMPTHLRMQVIRC
jgi:hypothetical protein